MLSHSFPVFFCERQTIQKDKRTIEDRLDRNGIPENGELGLRHFLSQAWRENREVPQLRASALTYYALQDSTEMRQLV